MSIVNLQAWIKEAATRWSAVSNIITSHTALTSDAGQMLDEVLTTCGLNSLLPSIKLP